MTASGSDRELLVTWADPAATAGAAAGLSGLDYLRAFVRGDFPASPMGRLMGFRGVEVSEGRVVFAADPGERHLNPIGTVHGGFAATLLDSALGCSVHTTLPPGAGYTTVDLNVTFLRRITPATGPVLCEGTVVHRGRTVATAQARLTRVSDNKLLATGTTTCVLLVPPRPAAQPSVKEK